MATRTLRVLNIEDSERDASLLKRHLSRVGYDLIFKRVEALETMKAALETHPWDVILCDYSMPHFSALQALAHLKETVLDIPFIIISGTVGEELAVEAMRAGAHDYLMKDKLARLVPTIEREMAEAENRRARKQAERALRQSEERFRRYFELGLVGMAITSATKGIIEVNDQICAILGYSRGELLQLSWHDVIHPDDLAPDQNNFERAIAGEIDSYSLDERFIRKNGQVVHTTISVRCLRKPDGSIDYFVAMVQDITERKLAEEEQARLAAQIESQRQRLNNIVASVPGVVWEVWGEPDAQRINFVSDYVQKMLGYSVEEWLSTPNFWHSIVHPDDRERTARISAEDFASGKNDSTMEFRWVAKDGRVLWAQSNSAVITDREGRPVGLRGVTIDITKRKRAENAVKQAEEKYRSIFENAVEGIFQSTPDGRLISVNPSMARILGYQSPEEMIADRTNILTQHYVDANSREELEALLAEHDVLVGYECEVYRKDQSKIWAAQNVRVVRDEAGALLYYEGSLEDITERKTLTEQLRQSQKLEAIGMLAGGIAHDFNNLLTVIKGYGDLTLMRLHEEDPIYRNISEVKRAADRAASLTRQLLAFSRKQVLQPKVLDLNALVLELEKMLRRLIGEDIELRTVLDSQLSTIKADPGQIEQIIMNLAVNARDAMPKGGKLTIETANAYLDEDYARNHISVKPGAYVMLAVSDTGMGMDQATQDRVFEPFFTTKEAGKGTGLGLSTVYGIVKQSGGSIWVYSELGQGTSFKIYLPPVIEGVSEDKRSSEVVGTIQGSETILLAEDEEMVRTLARQVLEMYGYHVLEASHGGAALLVCERHPGRIDLLITDVVMPEMSGRELADRLVQLRPNMKVLYMSGYTDKAIVHQGVLDEGADFIQKPFATYALARKVRAVLDAQTKAV
jgi:two-component system, cell cycle sensor histidine kinase and response regulator CckA